MWLRAPGSNIFETGEVVFVNTAPFQAILALSVSYAQNVLYIKIQKSCINKPVSMPLAEIILEDWKHYHTYINTNKDLSDLQHFMHTFNMQSERNVFSSELISEIGNIFNWVAHESYDNNMSHLICEYKPAPNNISPNPERSGSTELLYHLSDALPEYSDRQSPFAGNPLGHKKRFKSLLTKGENPNQTCKQGYPILFYAFSYYDDDFFKLLLVYGANPLMPMLIQPENTSYQVTNVQEKLYAFAIFKNRHKIMDASRHENYQRKYELTLNQYSRQGSLQKITADTSNFFTRERQIHSHFDFSDSKIFSNIKLNCDLTQFEEKQLIKLMTDRFYLPGDANGEKMKKAANNELYHNKRIIEILRSNNGEIIGVGVYEIIIDKSNKNYYFYVSLGILDEKYSEKQIMRLVTFRMAYALKLILPLEYNVGIYFLAVVHNSGLAFQQFPHYPKYQPDKLNTLVKDLVCKVAGRDCGYTHDIMSCYIQGQILPKDIKQKKVRSNLLKEHFYKVQLGNPGESTQGRAMPGFTFVSNKDFEYMAKFYGKKGINVAEHIMQLAKQLKGFLGDVLPEKHVAIPKDIFSAIPKTNITFWQPRLKKPSLQTTPFEKFHKETDVKTPLIAKL